MMKVKFGDVVNRVNIKVDRHHTDRIYYVGGEHIESNELMIHDKGLIKGSTIGYKFHFGFNPRHILFMSRNPHLRKCSMVNFSGVCSDSTYVVETKDDSVLLQDYLLFEMQSDRFWKWAEEHKSGGVNYLINYATLSSYEFFLPSLSVQRELSKKLWAAYRLKESYKKLLLATRDMVKSQFIEMFKDKKTNGKITDLVDTDIKSVKKSFNKDDLIEYIDISSVNAKSRTLNETTQYIVSSAPSRAQQCVQNGDILVSTVRPINRNVAVVDRDLTNLVASTGFCVLRPKDGYREYLLSIVTSDRYTEKMCDIASGGLYPAVNNNDVLSYDIFIPEKDFLNRVTQIYRQTDKSEFELPNQLMQ